jgi:hypothetical protein
LETDALKILISDLHSLVSMEEASSSEPLSYLRILHKSFSDFLDAETRAKDLFVPPSRSRALGKVLSPPHHPIS